MDTTIPQDDSARNLTPKTTFIYALIDPRDNSVRYIGKSNNPSYRLKQHLKDKEESHKTHWIQNLVQSGLIPTLHIIEQVPLEKWVEREIFWIAFYRAQGSPLTNTTDGGENPPSALGRIASEETRRKRSIAFRGRTFSPESRVKMSAAQKGKKRNPESVAKSASTQRGKKQPPDAIAKTAAAHRGKKDGPMSEEQKRKISASTKGVKKSAEMRARLSAARKGIKCNPPSEETKRKMSEAHRGIRPSLETRAKRSATMKRIHAMKRNPPDAPTLWDHAV